MIYRYKVTIPRNRIFMREYDVDSSMSLYRLREFLDSDMGFSPDQMTLFETFDAAGNPRRRIGLFDMGDGSMDRVKLEDLTAGEEPCLHYVYNLSLNLRLELRLEEVHEPAPRRSYPVLLAEKGRNPDQFSALYEDYGEFMEAEGSGGDDSLYESEELPEGEEGL